MAEEDGETLNCSIQKSTSHFCTQECTLSAAHRMNCSLVKWETGHPGRKRSQELQLEKMRSELWQLAVGVEIKCWI